MKLCPLRRNTHFRLPVKNLGRSRIQSQLVDFFLWNLKSNFDSLGVLHQNLNDFKLLFNRTCVAKVPSSSEEHAVAYITCKKIDQELQLTFEIWLFPVSIVFLVITLYIYLTELKELRSPQDVAFIFSMYCLLFHMILFMIRYSNGNKNASITIFYNYVGRYFKTAYFSWFNIMLISRLIENRNL